MVKLNKKALEFALKLVKQGKYVITDSWNPPSADDENRYIEENGIEAFSRWHLGVDDEANEETKGAWKFIFTSDFENVDRKGIVAIRQRSAQFKYEDIFEAAGKVLDLIDEQEEKNLSQNVVFRSFDCEAKQVDKNIVDFVITTEDIDRYGERVLSNGCQFENYLKNPVVLFAHDWTMPIGKCLGIRILNGKIEARTEFFPDLIEDPKMKTAVNLALNGVLKAVSIGFIPKKVDYERINDETIKTYTEWELVEYSLVSIPANPNALAKDFSPQNQKAGRVISQANLEKLLQACDLMEQALATIRELLTLAQPKDEIPTAEITSPEKPEKQNNNITIIDYFDFVSQFFGGKNE